MNTQSTKRLNLSDASPVYPITNEFGSVIAPGVESTKIVRCTDSEGFISDYSVEMLLHGHPTPGMFKYPALDAGVSQKEAMRQVIEFAKKI